MFFKWIMKVIFPERLKSLREKAGKSQEQMAHIMEVNQRTISNWEKGKAEPSLARLLTMAQVFKVDLNFLMCIDTETYKTLCKAVAINYDMLYFPKDILKIVKEAVNNILFTGTPPLEDDLLFGIEIDEEANITFPKDFDFKALADHINAKDKKN